MNREEVKLRIMEQFKNGASPICSLMLRPGNPGHRYWSTKLFWIKDYGLEMTVESMDGHSSEFQVLFGEANPKAIEYKNELSPYTYVNKTFVEEKIFVEKTLIVFELEAFCVTHEDYQFELNDFGLVSGVNPFTSWSFNLETKKFACRTPTKDTTTVLEFIETLSKCRKNPEINYVQARMSQGLIGDISNLLKYVEISETEKSWIMSIFSSTKLPLNPLESTPFSRILSALHLSSN